MLCSLIYLNMMHFLKEKKNLMEDINDAKTYKPHCCCLIKPKTALHSKPCDTRLLRLFASFSYYQTTMHVGRMGLDFCI